MSRANAAYNNAIIAHNNNNNNNTPTQMDQVRVQAEQLRIEAQVVRKKVSEVSKDLIEYCEKEKPHDMLVSGPQDNHNPFQEKKSCTIL
uniref:Guanine nucleotide-binding protein subunit gamma n=2 Tax=Ascaris TaxID=6251 RepID=A0A0M3I036_ASCLU